MSDWKYELLWPLESRGRLFTKEEIETSTNLEIKHHIVELQESACLYQLQIRSLRESLKQEKKSISENNWFVVIGILVFWALSFVK